MPSELIVTGVKDALAASLGILESARKEVVWIASPSLLSFSIRLGFAEKTKPFIQGGGASRGIVQISQANFRDVEICLETGKDVRHSDDVRELWMFVSDAPESVSAINTGVYEFTLDTPMTAFWSDSPTYAQYLLDLFEARWSEAVPAAERLQELLVQGAGKR